VECKTFEGVMNTVALNSHKLLNNIITLFFIQYFHNISTGVNMRSRLELPESINDSSDANDANIESLFHRVPVSIICLRCTF